MRLSRASIACLALTATAACGGDLLGAQPGDGGQLAADAVGADSAAMHDSGPARDGRAPVDAGVEADGDAAMSLDAPVVACGVSWKTLIEAWSAPPWDGGYRFNRLDDLLGFFRSMARIDAFVDPAHGVDCGPDGGGACTYDPTEPQRSPQDIHYSNSLGQFEGPDGHPYVWSYFPPDNEWLIADQSTSPQSYQLLLELNAGCMAGCPCDGG